MGHTQLLKNVVAERPAGLTPQMLAALEAQEQMNAALPPERGLSGVHQPRREAPPDLAVDAQPLFFGPNPKSGGSFYT